MEGVRGGGARTQRGPISAGGGQRGGAWWLPPARGRAAFSRGAGRADLARGAAHCRAFRPGYGAALSVCWDNARWGRRRDGKGGAGPAHAVGSGTTKKKALFFPLPPHSRLSLHSLSHAHRYETMIVLRPDMSDEER